MLNSVGDLTYTYSQREGIETERLREKERDSERQDTEAERNVILPGGTDWFILHDNFTRNIT